MLPFFLLVCLAAQGFLCSLGLLQPLLWGRTPTIVASKWRREPVFCAANKRGSLTKGGSVYEYISGGERNEAGGGSRWRNSTSKSKHGLLLALRGAPPRGAPDFKNPIQCGELFMFASLSLVFGFKAAPYHESQILDDMAEIALSKMQSAKAASSADELLQLWKRQWLVSLAVTGETQKWGTWKTRWNLNRSIFLEIARSNSSEVSERRILKKVDIFPIFSQKD